MNANTPKNTTPKEEDKPLDPATEKVRKRLAKYGAIFMGFNMLALMAVLGALVYKLGGFGENKSQITGEAHNNSQIGAPIEPNFDTYIDLPDGVTIVNASQNGSQILLNLRFVDNKAALWIYDINTQSIVGRISVQ
ncbi:MAG: hypothetical protein COC00_009745 [Rhizobiales bacterium]|nr:hypothetical protein [Hyphomicrobiales bacterium]